LIFDFLERKMCECQCRYYRAAQRRKFILKYSLFVLPLVFIFPKVFFIPLLAALCVVMAWDRLSYWYVALPIFFAAIEVWHYMLGTPYF
jgi:hypothetical protein